MGGVHEVRTPPIPRMKDTETTPLRQRLQRAMPGIVLSPSLLLLTCCVYGLIAYTAVLSFTGSKMLPRFDFVGLKQYVRLFNTPAGCSP